LSFQKVPYLLSLKIIAIAIEECGNNGVQTKFDPLNHRIRINLFTRISGQANQISTVTPNTAANQTLATHLVLKLKERKVYVYQDKQVLAAIDRCLSAKKAGKPHR
jgi:hypothetical protein